MAAAAGFLKMKKMLIVLCVALMTISSNNAQSWTRKRSRSSKVLDQEESEPDPSVYGNFAAMNELAKTSSRKTDRKGDRRKGPTKVRRTPKGNADVPNMEDLLSQINSPEMTEMMKQFSEGGGDKLSEMIESMVDKDKLEEMMQGMKDLEGLDMASLMDMSMKMMKGALEDNDEIKQLLENPEQLKEAMLPFVEAMGGDVEKLDEMLKDKDSIKSTMMEGVEKMQELASSFVEEMDPSTKETFERLLSGDETALQDVMSQFTDADFDMSEMKNLFGDQALENIDIQEMLSKLEEVVADGEATLNKRSTLIKRGDSERM